MGCLATSVLAKGAGPLARPTSWPRAGGGYWRRPQNRRPTGLLDTLHWSSEGLSARLSARPFFALVHFRDTKKNVIPFPKKKKKSVSLSQKKKKKKKKKS